LKIAGIAVRFALQVHMLHLPVKIAYAKQHVLQDGWIMMGMATVKHAPPVEANPVTV